MAINVKFDTNVGENKMVIQIATQRAAHLTFYKPFQAQRYSQPDRAIGCGITLGIKDRTPNPE